MKKFTWWMIIIAMLMFIALIYVMSTDAYAQDEPCSCLQNPNNSDDVQCWKYVKKGEYTYAIHCNPEKPKPIKEELSRKLFTSNTYAIIGFDNSTDLGYERTIAVGISNEMRYKNIWFLNDFVISPGDKIGIEGGHWITFTNHSYYEFSNNYLIGAGLKYHYVNTSNWDKNAVFGLASVGYRWETNYVSAKFALDYIYGTYDDVIGSTQQGLQLNMWCNSWQNKLRILTGINYYVLSCDTCNRQDAWSANIGIGVKI